MKTFALLTALVVVSASGEALAAKKITLGVFLPTVVNDGQERFSLSEKLGSELSQALGQPVTVKNFGRAEDFEKAARSQLDIAIVEAPSAVQLGSKAQLLASAQVDGDSSQRWAIVASHKGAVVHLAGKKLAVPRSFKGGEAKFVTNVIFGGDLDAKRHFKVVPVPNVESALTALESKTVDAALVPAAQSLRSGQVIFRSGRIPSVVAMGLKQGDETIRQALLKMGSVAPLDRFTEPREVEFSRLRQLIVKGPPPRLPALSEVPPLRPEPAALVNLDELGWKLPSFLDSMESSRELPDD